MSTDLTRIGERLGENSEELSEEPDVWEIRLSGSVRGRGTTEGMAEILWHRRETRRQTEKTNVSLKPREAPVYSTTCHSVYF
jgi:hypothetical protein